MARPPFDFLESVCEKLVGKDTAILPPDNFSELTITGLLDTYKELVPSAAIARALDDLDAHFVRRGSRLPFTYHPDTAEYLNDRDPEYVRFISEASGIRGDGAMSRTFEVSIASRLVNNLTGQVHRVGWPRGRSRLKAEYLTYLMALGFSEDVVYGKDKDCGFDVLWLPPLGAIPIRPVVSLQCKNSQFKEKEAEASTSRAKKSLRLHSIRTAESTYMCCVVFNDYIDDLKTRTFRGAGFIPLGLSDLSSLTIAAAIDVL
jgi:hypothetical protein